MTHPTYTQQALCRYNLPHLKRIAAELGVTPIGDKRAVDTWVNAIITHQSTRLQKVDNQAAAQAELDSYIADQAQAVAPELLTIVEISFDHHEYYADDKLVASISHDDNHLTQRWVVMVNDKELFRANTLMRCDRFICTHYKDGSLPVQEEAEGQGAGSRGERFSPMHPAPCSLSSSTTEKQIMAHIFNECQNYNNSQLPIRNSQLHPMPKNRKLCTCNDSITNYVHNCELRTANCELLSNWWVKRRYSVQQQYSNSVLDAVRSLSMVDVSTDGKSIFDEYFLDQPLEQLTGDKLQRLLERTELVTA
ncbi:MAG: hypothetical protein RM049_36780 [Nostoc sp. DedQUE04]|uniref:hypothetical protein n=1 Tax=Nostoc sp. DedQUE04 TaxID=3075390 RepID=UPI002AD2F141|nr:hypothetical protein [Nostoc sp. DedQUE04]MDZ8140788.1 hypothetical protein [Nostoc sp. DedQUE04]